MGAAAARLLGVAADPGEADAGDDALVALLPVQAFGEHPEARGGVVEPDGAVDDVADDAVVEAVLAGALSRLLALIERYPDLKASSNALQLQEELVSTENRIAFARQAYNDAVMAYNTRLSVFPDMLVARVFGFVPAGLFEAEATERALPAVDLAPAAGR